MKTVDMLNSMLDDIKNHQRDKNTLLQNYIQIRLEAGLKSYYSSLMSSLKTLEKYDEKKVLKKLIQK